MVEMGWYSDEYGIHIRRFTFWWLIGMTIMITMQFVVLVGRLTGYWR